MLLFIPNRLFPSNNGSIKLNYCHIYVQTVDWKFRMRNKPHIQTIDKDNSDVVLALSNKDFIVFIW